jgi:dolichyl-diphosphooligosaccharide---protein glycosyltransferase
MIFQPPVNRFRRGPAGYDRTRNAVIGNKDFDLTYLEEAYTSEHWLVRIYRVKKPHEFNRPALKSDSRVVPSNEYITKKVNKNGNVL